MSSEDKKAKISKSNDDEYPENYESLSDDEKIDIAAAKILKRYKKAFLDLANGG